MRLPILACLSLAAGHLAAQVPTTPPLPAGVLRDLDTRIARVAPKVVSWRRDLHEHPELSYAEERTAGVVAAHLRSLGLEVRTNVGGTFSVVAVLRGGRPGPAVALRADMDGLPVTEQTGLPFASKVRTQYNGQTVGVMHACGHDAHTAILMGTAEVLAGMKATLPGSVTFLFQAAEESAPDGGAKPMIEAGALENPRVEAVYGLHTWPGPTGTVSTRSGGLMASGDNWRIVVHGRQAHGAQPWRSVDPIVIGAQIVSGLQTIVSRNIDLTAGPAVVTVGAFQAGVRENIIPDSAVMFGTFRTFNETARQRAAAQIRTIAEQYAAAGGATATVTISMGYATTSNDPRWFGRASTTLRNALGGTQVLESAPSMPAEDFSRFLEKVPGMFFFLGVTPKGRDPLSAPANHSPMYDVDEAAFPTGVKALSVLAIDALLNGVPPLGPLK
ncbi:MAG: amidohydrolase [Gemmatimonadaceae bacterium]|nr:amidohydrolase [Gemmatimonadaceae bacterium]